MGFDHVEREEAIETRLTRLENEREARRANTPEADSHPILDNRHKPSANNQTFTLTPDTDWAKGDRVILKRCGRNGSHSIPLVPLEVDGEPGIQVGCTWISAKVIEQAYFMMSPPRMIFDPALISREDLANIASNQKMGVIFPSEAEVVTSLPLQPRPSRRKKDSGDTPHE